MPGCIRQRVDDPPFLRAREAERIGKLHGTGLLKTVSFDSEDHKIKVVTRLKISRAPMRLPRQGEKDRGRSHGLPDTLHLPC